MRLRVSNIGKIGQAEIVIDGITVIAGENNTGKSTLGKALWCMFNSCHDLHARIVEERVARIARIVMKRVGTQLRYYGVLQRLGIEDLLIAFVTNGDSSVTAAWELLNEIAGILNGRHGDASIDESELHIAVEEIVSAMSTDDAEVLAFFLESCFSNEFYGQARSLYGDEPGEVGLTIQSEEATVSLHDHAIGLAGNMFDLHTEAVYFDDPFILDEVDRTYGRSYVLSQRSVRSTTHRSHLRSLLQRPFESGNALESIEANKRLAVIYDKLSGICDGKLIASGRDGTRFFFAPRGLNDSLALGNLSSGLKTFVTITMLLSSGTIEENGTIILDEPEIHLHPAWQTRLAELVVLLQKEFGLHVLLTCHSPYLIRGIETYSIKYGIENVCRYYFSSVDERGVAFLTDASEDMESIYRALFLPLQDLENEQAYL